jgi:hypothetical protein
MIDIFVGLEGRRGYSVIVPAWPKLSKELMVVTATSIGPIAFMMFFSHPANSNVRLHPAYQAKRLSAATKEKPLNRFRY